MVTIKEVAWSDRPEMMLRAAKKQKKEGKGRFVIKNAPCRVMKYALCSITEDGISRRNSLKRLYTRIKGNPSVCSE